MFICSFDRITAGWQNTQYTNAFEIWVIVQLLSELANASCPTCSFHGSLQLGLVHVLQEGCCTTNIREIKLPATVFAVAWAQWLIPESTSRVVPLPLQQVAPGVAVSCYSANNSADY
jgi:hypothetical protein